MESAAMAMATGTSREKGTGSKEGVRSESDVSWWDETLKFLEPVLDDVDLRRARALWALWSPAHHEPLAVGCDVVVGGAPLVLFQN